MTLDSNVFSLSSIMGTSSQQSVIDAVGARCGGGSFFNTNQDPFRTGFEHFMQQVVLPTQQVKITLANTAKSIMMDDRIRPINSLEALSAGIPPAMYMPILYYAPIRALLEQGSITGFGIRPEDLEEEDPYEIPLANGYVRELRDAVDDDGLEIQFCEVLSSDAMDLSDDEIDDIQETRDFIDKFLSDEDTAYMDFTDFPDIRC